ncbi:hypothetical protein PCASD_14126 [Puccinia coronata f. sp. avenae]|uniref:Uncharacterized protein n=1 Tax=Puccinia coronata f. sp. avenae TaxID=200324 RepID=A0A2N5UFY4_9BASI|nr:hypothetical protein PCASD_14126 [Puccinia coronata f. sp. avenae]
MKPHASHAHDSASLYPGSYTRIRGLWCRYSPTSSPLFLTASLRTPSSTQQSVYRSQFFSFLSTPVPHPFPSTPNKRPEHGRQRSIQSNSPYEGGRKCSWRSRSNPSTKSTQFAGATETADNGSNEGGGHDEGDNEVMGNDRAEEDDIATALIYKDTLSAPPDVTVPATALGQPKSHLDQLWDKIVELLSSNDRPTADLLLKIYNDLKQEKAKTASAKPSSIESNTDSKVKVLEYVDGSVPTHFDIGFTPFFDKNIKELRGPLPLTIFNKDWQEDAMNFHSSKKAKSDEKEGIYSGFEYPNEWTQLFATWTSNFRNFLITYRDIYKNEKMGKWIEKHKTNVDQLISDDGFMVGFRYDMWVRQNAFAYKVTTATGGTSAVDIGKKFGFDPKTGKPRTSKHTTKAPDQGKESTSSSNKARGGGRGQGGGNWNSGDRQDSRANSETPNQWGKRQYDSGEDYNRGNSRDYGGGGNKSRGGQGDNNAGSSKGKQM